MEKVSGHSVTAAGSEGHNRDTVDLNIALPLLTSVLSLGFAGALLWRFGHRQEAYHLVWSIGLLGYALSAGAEVVGGRFGWWPELYRWWYLAGAIGVAAYLGAGTVYLHRESTFRWLVSICLALGCVPPLAAGYWGEAALGLLAAACLAVVHLRRGAWFGHVAFAALVIGTLLAAAQVLRAPVDTSLLPTSSQQVVTGQAFGPDVRILTPPFNIAGAAALLAGALISAWQFWRARTQPRRVLSNGLIALGAFVPSFTSGLTRFGLSSAFFAGELVGVACILAGFM